MREERERASTWVDRQVETKGTGKENWVNRVGSAGYREAGTRASLSPPTSSSLRSSSRIFTRRAHARAFITRLDSLLLPLFDTRINYSIPMSEPRSYTQVVGNLWKRWTALKAVSFFLKGIWVKSVTIGGRAVGLTKSNVQPKVGETGFVNIVHIVSAIKKGGFASTKYSCFVTRIASGVDAKKPKGIIQFLKQRIK